MYSLATPPIKLKLGQQIRGGTTNSKPPGRIIMMGQSETHLAPVRSDLLHSFLHVRGAAAPFCLCHGNQRNYAEPKLFS